MELMLVLFLSFIIHGIVGLMNSWKQIKHWCHECIFLPLLSWTFVLFFLWSYVRLFILSYFLNFELLIQGEIENYSCLIWWESYILNQMSYPNLWPGFTWAFLNLFQESNAVKELKLEEYLATRSFEKKKLWKCGISMVKIIMLRCQAFCPSVWINVEK